MTTDSDPPESTPDRTWDELTGQTKLRHVYDATRSVRRALDKLGLKHNELPLEGEVAIASGGGDDVTAPARLIHEFGKKLTDKLTILGGIFEGKLMGQAAMQEIAMIPPMQTLRAMFAQVLNSPRQRFAVVLSKVAEKKT